MTYEVLLAFADPVRPEEFLDLIEELGGVRHPDGWTSGRLSREGRNVWVQVAPNNKVGFEPGDLFSAPALRRSPETNVRHRPASATARKSSSATSF